jgi:hypothetical protein
MLPGGACVDTIVEWECDRCHLHDTTTAAESLCGHLHKVGPLGHSCTDRSSDPSTLGVLSLSRCREVGDVSALVRSVSRSDG